MIKADSPWIGWQVSVQRRFDSAGLAGGAGGTRVVEQRPCCYTAGQRVLGRKDPIYGGRRGNGVGRKDPTHGGTTGRRVLGPKGSDLRRAEGQRCGAQRPDLRRDDGARVLGPKGSDLRRAEGQRVSGVKTRPTTDGGAGRQDPRLGQFSYLLRWTLGRTSASWSSLVKTGRAGSLGRPSLPVSLSCCRRENP